MDATKVHLLLNYLPLAGLVIGLIVLLLGSWKGSHRIIRTALSLLFLTGLATLAVLATGEIAGKGAGLLVGPEFTRIVQHQTAARATFAGIELTAVFAAIGLFATSKGRSLLRWQMAALLILAIVSIGATAYTVHLGRTIHTAAPAAK